MKTRQKLNLRKRESEILELGGNHFKVGPFYRLYLDFPFKTGEQCLTRDLYSDKAFNLIHTSKGIWYAVFWIPELEMYLLRKLQWLEYREDVDIRKAYLYGRYGKKRKPL